MEERTPDIFDRILRLPGLRLLDPFYRKHREVLLYLFFGGCTTVVSIASYAVLTIPVRLHELIANVISWILAVLFAYMTNRKWVFRSQASGAKAVTAEAASFFGGRLFTLAVEEGIIFVFITLLAFPGMAVKITAQIIIIILNYIISKTVVFGKNRRGN